VANGLGPMCMADSRHAPMDVVLCGLFAWLAEGSLVGWLGADFRWLI
jgi:hypothetical protein